MTNYNYFYDVHSEFPLQWLDQLMAEASDMGINTVLLRNDLSKEPIDWEMYRRIQSIAYGNDLHIFAGGLRYENLLDEIPHNTEIINILDSSNRSRSGYHRLTGITGFDEPDTWWEDSAEIQDDLETVMLDAIDLAHNRFYDMKVSSWFCREKEETIEAFCEWFDAPAWDEYPRTLYTQDFNDFEIGSTCNIFLATELQNTCTEEYEYYLTRDEVIRLYLEEPDPSHGVYLYKTLNSNVPDGMTQTIFDTFYTSWGEPPTGYASSDYRAMDVGNRQEQEHDINGAIVVWDQMTDDNMVIYNHDTADQLIDHPLPVPAGRGIVECCVGEINYPVVYPQRSDRVGIIGSGPLRIVCCYRNAGNTYARVFSKDYNRSEGFINVTNYQGSSTYIPIPSEIDYESMDILWGAFWHGPNAPDNPVVDPESGFVIFDAQGHYVVVYQDDSDPERWNRTQVHDDLLPSDVISDGMYAISRDNSKWPSPQYAVGRDYIVAVSGSGEFHWVFGRNAMDGLNQYNSQDIMSNIVDISLDRSISHEYRNRKADNLIVSVQHSGNLWGTYKSYPLDFNSPEGQPIKAWDPLYWSYAGPIDLLNTARMHSTRRPFRSSICLPPSSNVFFRDCEFSYTDRMDHYHELMNSIWVNGIQDTDHCFMPNIQAKGHLSQGPCDFCPSADDIRYMAASAIVHGARGLQFYNLELALESSPEQTIADNQFRCPPELVEWGPSIDPFDTDMIGRVHEVTNEISPVCDELVDNAAMTSGEARHGYNELGLPEYEEDPNCNFIAVKDEVEDIIWVVLANNSDQYAEDNRAIWFPGHLMARYTLEPVSGWAVSGPSMSVDIGLRDGTDDVSDSSSVVGSNDVMDLCVMYENMPPYSCSFFRLIPSRQSSENSSRRQIIWTHRDDGSVIIKLDIPQSYEHASVDLYDISGRLVGGLWQSSGGQPGSYRVSVDSDMYCTGMYFVRLRLDDEAYYEKLTLH